MILPIMPECQPCRAIHDSGGHCRRPGTGGKQHFPTQRNKEKAILFKFFKEACIASNSSFKQWTQYAQSATKDLYSINWSLKNIMQIMISKVKWAREPPINQWAVKVKSGTGSTRNMVNSPAVRVQYEYFMFNPTIFSKLDIEKLRKLSQQLGVARSG